MSISGFRVGFVNLRFALASAVFALLVAGGALAAEPGSPDVSDVTPTPVAAAPAQPRPNFTYVVQSGDSLGSIATRFGVSLADLLRLNRLDEDSELIAGDTLKIPNPFLARERELTGQLARMTADKETAEQAASRAEQKLLSVMGQIQDLSTSNQLYSHEVNVLPWWRRLAVMTAAATVLMLGAMLLALFEWWILRGRFRAVAEMNNSLRRLDYKYKSLLARAELRLQELYGRRRRGLQEGQERLKTSEELEIERLDHQLEEILQRYLQRLGPPNESARRARSRELVGGIGSPVEVRSARR
jgi:LysM repeat protein